MHFHPKLFVFLICIQTEQTLTSLLACFAAVVAGEMDVCHVRLDKVIITDIHSNCWSFTLLSQNLRHKPRVNPIYLFKTRIKFCCVSTYHSTDKHPECLYLVCSVSPLREKLCHPLVWLPSLPPSAPGPCPHRPPSTPSPTSRSRWT